MTDPAFRLLCEGLSLYRRPERVDAFRALAKSGGVSWENFVATASEQQLAAVFHHAIRTFGLDDALPTDVVDYFDGMAILCRQRNDRVLEEAVDVARLLNEIDVAPIFLKGGGHLLSGLYPDAAMRVMVDLDILVPPGAMAECATHLASAGFETLSDYHDPRSHQHPPLGRPGAAASVELHRDVLGYPYDRVLSASEARRDTVEIDAGGARAGILSLPHRIVHNIAHAQLMDHGYVFGLLRLRDLFDFALLARELKERTDWAEIERRFSANRFGIAYDFHRLAAERLTGSDNPRTSGPGVLARAAYARAVWLQTRPAWRTAGIRLLRPPMLLKRALSDGALRRRLYGNLADPAWYRRQWRMLRGRKPKAD